MGRLLEFLITVVAAGAYAWLFSIASPFEGGLLIFFSFFIVIRVLRRRP